MLNFIPKKQLQDTLNMTSTSSTASVDISSVQTELDGALLISFPSGQGLSVPVKTVVSTPFITVSSALVYFGVCRVTKSCDGIMLLCNPSDVTASWSVVAIPGGGVSRRATDIQVSGYEGISLETDDPSVFELSPTAGVIEGPTQSVTAAMAALPKDPLRRYARWSLHLMSHV